MSLKGQSLIVLIVAVAGLNFTFFGYDQGFLGGVLGSDDLQDLLGRPSPDMTGLLVAIYNIGCALGALVAFVLGEYLGRKKSIIYASLVTIAGAAIQTGSFSYWQMFVGRIIAGIGVGCATVAVPILQSETLPARKRGALLVIQSALCLVGISVASWLCLATSFSNSSFRWRFPMGFQIVGEIAGLILFIWLPESPRWLAKQDQVEKAREIIARLLDKPENDPEVAGAMNEIMTNIAQESSELEPTWREVFSNSNRTRNLQRMFLGMAPYMMNQWSGVNSLTFYLAYIIENFLGFSGLMSLILASSCFTQMALLSIPAYFYIDRIGRRWSVILSSAGCSICMIVIAGSLTLQSYATAATAVAFIFLFLDFFTAGILPVSWSYSSEIQPLRVRNKATAIGVFAHWMSNFVVVLVTPIGMDSIGTNYFWIWAVINALFVPLTWLFGVETAGRTLEQIDEMFLDNPRICMGLNREYRQVIRVSANDEEVRRKEFASHDKGPSVELVENN